MNGQDGKSRLSISKKEQDKEIKREEWLLQIKILIYFCGQAPSSARCE